MGGWGVKGRLNNVKKTIWSWGLSLNKITKCPIGCSLPLQCIAIAIAEGIPKDFSNIGLQCMGTHLGQVKRKRIPLGFHDCDGGFWTNHRILEDFKNIWVMWDLSSETAKNRKDYPEIGFWSINKTPASPPMNLFHVIYLWLSLPPVFLPPHQSFCWIELFGEGRAFSWLCSGTAKIGVNFMQSWILFLKSHSWSPDYINEYDHFDVEDIIEMVSDNLGGHDEVEKEVGRTVAQRKQVHHLVTTI